MAGMTREQLAERKAKADADARKADAGVTGAELNDGNPREPVDQAREGAKPMTVASGGLPVGTPGTVVPEPLEDVFDRRIVASERVPMARVKILRDYFTAPDSKRLKAGGLPPEKWSSLRYGFAPCGGCCHGTEEAYG